MSLTVISIKPYQQWFSETLHKLGLIHHDAQYLNDNDYSTDEDENTYLRRLDPRNWKEQDHYKVLGLRTKRYTASEDEIKQAYRKKILAHHPDKRRHEEVIDAESDYFACITKAYEILGDPIKRRSYDSVDNLFSDEIPPVSAQSKSEFFETFTPVFNLNARWSNIQPVPSLGNINDNREEVENFYKFWYNFESWREFSYLDEEDKERGQDRSERKWIEKQNKLARQKRKKEEMARIRRLVDNAYSCDPRVAKFREEDKQKKLQIKKAKEDAKKAKAEEEERLKKEFEELELKKKLKEEELLKQKKEQDRKEKEAVKKQRRKEKKQLEQIFEENNYFSIDENEKVMHLQDFDKICQTVSWEEFVEFKDSMINAKDVNSRRCVFKEKVNEINNKLNQERNEIIKNKKQSDNKFKEGIGPTKGWIPEDIQLLIKAVNLFPAGTQNRWEVIAAFVNQHSSVCSSRKARDVLTKAKELNKLDDNFKQEISQNAVNKFLDNSAKSIKIQDSPSQRYDGLEIEPKSEPWTNEEQQLLEQALKTYPTFTNDRWDRIAECIPNRTKKECIKRFKELVELIKAKKAAQDAVHTNVKKY